jgi:hypothetical protein
MVAAHYAQRTRIERMGEALTITSLPFRVAASICPFDLLASHTKNLASEILQRFGNHPKISTSLTDRARVSGE